MSRQWVADLLGGGAELTVPIAIAGGDDVEMEIVDDPSFPLILRRSEYGDDNVVFHGA